MTKNIFTLFREGLKPGDKIRAEGSLEIFIYAGVLKDLSSFKRMFRSQVDDELICINTRLLWEKVQ